MTQQIPARSDRARERADFARRWRALMKVESYEDTTTGSWVAVLAEVGKGVVAVRVRPDREDAERNAHLVLSLRMVDALRLWDAGRAHELVEAWS